jgi:ATP-binding cassette subfamily B protein
MARRPTAASFRPAEDRAVSRDIRPLLELWPFVRPYGLRLAAAIAASAVSALMVLALGRGIGALIDRGFGAGRPELLDQAMMVIIIGTIILVTATYIRVSLIFAVGERVVADIRRRLYSHIIALSPSFFEMTRTGEVLSRLTVDATLLQTVAGATVSLALRNLLLFVGGIIMMLITSPKLTGIAFLVVPLVVLPIILFGRKVRRLSRQTQDRIAEMSAYAEESLHAVRTVQAFTHEPIDRLNLGARIDAGLKAVFAHIRARALLVATVMLLVLGSIAFVLWIGGHDVLAGRLTAGELSAFIIYAIFVAGAIGAFSEVIGDLQRAAGAMERLAELLNTRPLVAAPANPAPLPKPAAGAVSLENVTFFYPSRPETPSLDRFTLDVRAGEKIALVGPSGAGKTTVFQLLLRFYDPQSGSIRLDGVELRDADPQQLRARIGLVPQEPVIFAASALENIRYGRPDADDAAVRAAADAAYASEFLDRLPQGFASQLGERGVRLSGGQRQRIALARAILRDPALLLLDEATSALDAESERMVQQALDRLMVGRTTLVIAHRLATVLKADRIVVMDHGRGVEEGSHAELVRRDGLYARLAALQFDQGPMAESEQSLRQIAE